ncbi:MULTISPECIES: polysaccharide pyruvyl transferase family protein [unclassified Frankia]
MFPLPALASTVGILRSPLLRNAILLMASTAITGVLGIAFWAIAAWLYSPENVGRASTAVSTMLLLSGLAQLNQQNILPATIPAAARSRRTIIRNAYAMSGLLATVLALGFVALFSHTTFLADFDPWFSVFFVAAVAFWCIFALQDSVLAGLRKASWVPIENAFFAASKLVLLFVFAAFGISAGLFFAWTAPVILLVLAINILIWRRVLSRNQLDDVAESSRNAPHATATGSRRRADWYIIGDMAGGLVQLAATTLLPVIVSARLGYEATAYFYTSWSLVSVFDQLMSGATASLTVEGTRESSRVSAHILSMIKFLLAFIVPVGIITAVFAGPLLAIYGSEYSSEAANLLSCLALGAVFRATILLAVAISRVQRNTRLLLAIQGSMSVCLLTTALIVGSRGLTAIGLAYLGCHAVIALAVVPVYVRALRRPSSAISGRRSPRSERAVYGEPRGASTLLPAVLESDPPAQEDLGARVPDAETTWLIWRRPSAPSLRPSASRQPTFHQPSPWKSSLQSIGSPTAQRRADDTVGSGGRRRLVGHRRRVHHCPDVSRAGPAARARGRPTEVTASRSPHEDGLLEMQRVALAYLGYAGRGNLGDDAIELVYKRALPGVLIAPLPLYPGDVPVHLRARRRLSFQDSSLLLGGGTVIGRKNWRVHLLTGGRIVRRRPFHMLGAGVEDPVFQGRNSFSANGELGKWRRLLDQFDRVTVRGPRSAELLRDVGVDSEVVGDPALLLEPGPVPRTVDEGVLGINVGWGDDMWGHDPERVTRELGLALSQLARRGWRFRAFLANNSDRPYTERLLTTAGVADRTETYVTVDPDTYLHSVRGCSVLVAQRLHAAILACAAAVPTIAISYQPKCDDFMASVGQEQFLVRTDEIDSEPLVDLVEKVDANRTDHVTRLQTEVDARRAALIGSLDRITHQLSLGGTGR